MRAMNKHLFYNQMKVGLFDKIIISFYSEKCIINNWIIGFNRY